MEFKTVWSCFARIGSKFYYNRNLCRAVCHAGTLLIYLSAFCREKTTFTHLQYNEMKLKPWSSLYKVSYHMIIIIIPCMVFHNLSSLLKRIRRGHYNFSNQIIKLRRQAWQLSSLAFSCSLNLSYHLRALMVVTIIPNEPGD